jgi:hypothetical protein
MTGPTSACSAPAIPRGFIDSSISIAGPFFNTLLGLLWRLQENHTSFVNSMVVQGLALGSGSGFDGANTTSP